jgi:hypothetical protein
MPSRFEALAPLATAPVAMLVHVTPSALERTAAPSAAA